MPFAVPSFGLGGRRQAREEPAAAAGEPVRLSQATRSAQALARSLASQHFGRGKVGGAFYYAGRWIVEVLPIAGPRQFYALIQRQADDDSAIISFRPVV